MASELSPGTISSILESVPGIANVLRSPVADAMVNLTRAAAGLAPFDIKDARELIRYAARRGLIGSDEGDRVSAEVEGAAQYKADKAAARKVARDVRKREKERARVKRARKSAAKRAAAKRKPASKARRKPAPKRKKPARKLKKRR